MFGNKLKELRINRGLSQDELGRILNTSGKNISSWERGITRPDIDTLKHISEFFNVSSDYLLSIQEEDDSKIHQLEHFLHEAGIDNINKALQILQILKENNKDKK